MTFRSRVAAANGLGAARRFLAGRGLDTGAGLAAAMALEAGDMRVVDIRSLRREISPVNDARAILEIRDVCRREGIQVVHTHSSKAGVVGRLGAFSAGVRGVAHTVHGFSFHDFMPPWQRAVFVGVERAMSRFTSTLVLLCESNAETARRERVGARRSREVIHYGIDFSPLDVPVDREAVRRSLGYTGGEIVVGFTGRFSEQKALHILRASTRHRCSWDWKATSASARTGASCCGASSRRPTPTARGRQSRRTTCSTGRRGTT